MAKFKLKHRSYTEEEIKEVKTWLRKIAKTTSIKKKQQLQKEIKSNKRLNHKQVELKARVKLMEIYKAKLKRNATPGELRTRRMLGNLGIGYRFQKGFLTDKSFYIVDFYLPKPYKMVIEIDGKHHEEFEQQCYDQHRDSYLKQKRHVKILRIKHQDIMTMYRSQLLELIIKTRHDPCSG